MGRAWFKCSENEMNTSMFCNLLHLAMLNVFEVLLLVDGKEEALLVLEERFRADLVHFRPLPI